MENNKQNAKIEIIRAVTRSLSMLIPLVALCLGMFIVDDLREIIIGGIIGSISTASVFYFEKRD